MAELRTLRPRPNHQDGGSPRRSMSQSLKSSLLIAVAIYAVLVVLLWILNRPSPNSFHSSPTLSRDVVAYKKGWLGLIKSPGRGVDESWPADMEMGRPEGQPISEALTLFQWPEHSAPERRNLPDRERIRPLPKPSPALHAFATWFPAAQDELPPEGDGRYPILFRDSETGAELDADGLLSLGVPEAFLSIDAPKLYHAPRLRLLFRNEGLEFLHALYLEVGDQRTGARVSYDLESLKEISHRFQSSGDWAVLDTALLAWHDTPLECRVGFVAGPAERQRLPRETGAEVAFGDLLRVQYLGTAPPGAAMKRLTHLPSKFSDSVPELQAARQASTGTEDTRDLLWLLSADGEIWAADEDPPQTAAGEKAAPADCGSASRPLIRFSSSTYLKDHLGVATPDGIVWGWEILSDTNRIGLASPRLVEGVPTVFPDDLELVFVPAYASATFLIDAIPDAPNPRSLENLFEARLPRLTLAGSTSEAERQIVGFAAVAAQVNWEHSRIWDDEPPPLPEDRTFREATPASLLDWYLKQSPGAFASYDEPGLTLWINERKSSRWGEFWERIFDFF